MPRGALALGWLLGLMGWIVADAFAADSPTDELKAVRGRIEELEKRLTEKEQKRQQASQAMKDSDRGIEQAQRRLKEIQTREKTLQTQLKELNTKRESLNTTLNGQRDVLGKLVYQQYVSGAPESIQLVLTGRDANQISRHLHYLTYVSKSRGEVISGLRQNIALLEDIAAQTAEKKKELEGLHAEAEKEKHRLEMQRESQSVALQKVTTEIKKNKEEIEALRRDAQRLAALVKHIARELAKKNKARRHARGRDASADSAFAKLKGKLRQPVIGDVLNRYGTPRSDTGLVWRGLIIASQRGDAVKAVADGEVAYAAALRGFGKLLILDHGDGYMSLYGYNQALMRKVGDRVEAGEKIATAGTGDGLRDSGLYFEIRVQGKPVDPMKWLAR